MPLLTPETLGDLLAEYDFENGCITHVSIDDPFTPGGAVARVVVDARDREHGWPWTPVEFRLSGLRDYRIEHGKGFSGMLYFDPVVSRFADTAHGELLYLDLDPVDGPSQYEPVDAVDIVGRSQCFFAAERMTWEVLPVDASPRLAGGQPTADG